MCLINKIDRIHNNAKSLHGKWTPQKEASFTQKKNAKQKNKNKSKHKAKKR